MKIKHPFEIETVSLAVHLSTEDTTSARLLVSNISEQTATQLNLRPDVAAHPFARASRLRQIASDKLDALSQQSPKRTLVAPTPPKTPVDIRWEQIDPTDRAQLKAEKQRILDEIIRLRKERDEAIKKIKERFGKEYERLKKMQELVKNPPKNFGPELKAATKAQYEGLKAKLEKALNDRITALNKEIAKGAKSRDALDDAFDRAPSKGAAQPGGDKTPDTDHPNDGSSRSNSFGKSDFETSYEEAIPTNSAAPDQAAIPAKGDTEEKLPPKGPTEPKNWDDKNTVYDKQGKTSSSEDPDDPKDPDDGETSDDDEVTVAEQTPDETPAPQEGPPDTSGTGDEGDTDDFFVGLKKSEVIVHSFEGFRASLGESAWIIGNNSVDSTGDANNGNPRFRGGNAANSGEATVGDAYAAVFSNASGGSHSGGGGGTTDGGDGWGNEESRGIPRSSNSGAEYTPGSGGPVEGWDGSVNPRAYGASTFLVSFAIYGGTQYQVSSIRKV